MATWPMDLPASPGWGGSESRQSNVIRTQNAGPKKMRRRYTATPTVHEFPAMLTDSQVVLLESFYYDTLFEVGVFQGLNHPRTGAPILFARFVEAPKYSNVGPDAYRVLLKIEELPVAP